MRSILFFVLLVFTSSGSTAQITIDPSKIDVPTKIDINKIPGMRNINPVNISPAKIKVFNNMVVTFYEPWENGMAAIEPTPGTNVPNGRLILSCGQNIAFPVIQKKIFDNENSTSVELLVASAIKFPELDSAQYGTDNQIVRLKDGSLLVMRSALIWKAMDDKPAWNDYIINGHKGNRGAVLFWKSVDNGDNWELISTIDFGSKALEKYGIPRPMNCKGDADVPLAKQCTEPGKDKWWIGGGDRPEFYACPYTGNLYLTTRIVSGLGALRRDNYLLFYSRNNGNTWMLAKDDLPSYESMVMTSTPDGSLFLFHENGSAPTVYIARFAKKRIGAIPQNIRTQPDELVVSKGYPVFFHLELKPGSILSGTIKNVECSFPDSLGSARLDRLAVGTPDIARMSESSDDSSVVYAAYQVRNSYKNQEYCIVRIAFGAKISEPVVSNVLRVTASDPAKYSVMHGNFIQPDFIKIPGTVKSGLCMFYWIESPRGGQAKDSFAVKYILLRNGRYTKTEFASVENSLGRYFTRNKNLPTGDYLRGAFFYHKNRYHFAPQWPGESGIRANVIAVDPDAIAY